MGKKKLTRLNTPIGEAVWPKLVTPDTFKGKVFYITKLRLPAAEAKGIVETLDKMADEALVMAQAKVKGKFDKKGKQIQPKRDDPYEIEVNKETGQQTGNLIFKFKSKNKPALFDAKKNPTNVEPWSGSRIRVSFAPDHYYVEATNGAGVTCYLNAVQIIELRGKGMTGDAGMYGFDEQEGYVAQDGEQTEEPTQQTQAGERAATSGSDF